MAEADLDDSSINKATSSQQVPHAGQSIDTSTLDWSDEQLRLYRDLNTARSTYQSKTYLQLIIDSSSGTSWSFRAAAFLYYIDSSLLTIVVPLILYNLAFDRSFIVFWSLYHEPFDEQQADKLIAAYGKSLDLGKHLTWLFTFYWIIQKVGSIVRNPFSTYEYLRDHMVAALFAALFVTYCSLWLACNRPNEMLVVQLAGSISSLRLAFENAAKSMIMKCRQFFRPRSRPSLGYQALHEGEFRLLKLRRRLPFCDPVASILHTTFPTAPTYEAISYTWGKTNATHVIEIDGCDLMIGRNAFDAIKDCSSIWGSRIVWIDQICINQNDLLEKSVQVPMMKAIYQNASCVLAYLGDDDTAGLAFAFVCYIMTMRKKSTNTDLLSPLMLSIYGDLMCSGIMRLLSNPWFSRVWIIQEVAVATKVVVKYGGILYDWNALVQAMQLLVLPGTNNLIYDKFNKDSIQALSNIYYISELRHDSQESQNYSSFVPFLETTPWRSIPSLLSSTRKFQSTDPRDKLYALQSLAHDKSDLMQRPDYLKSVEDVYLEFARAVLLRSCDPFLVMNSAGLGYPRNLDLPSWVPDWSQCDILGSTLNPYIDSEELKTVVQIFSRTDHPEDMLPVDSLSGQFAASSTSRPTAPQLLLCRRNSKIVSIKGVMVGSLRSATNVFRSCKLDDDVRTDWKGAMFKVKDSIAIYEWHQAALKLALSTSLSFDSIDACLDAFWRTLVADRWQLQRPAPNTAREHYEAWVTMLQMYHEVSVAWQNGQKDVCVPFEDAKFALARGHQAPWLTEFGSGAANRRFGLTNKGNMCIVPPLAQLEDVLFIPFGASMPWLIRPVKISAGKNDRSEHPDYLFVGECYVRNMMDGEMVQGVEPDWAAYQSLDASLTNTQLRLRPTTPHQAAVQQGTIAEFPPSKLQAQWIRLV